MSVIERWERIAVVRWDDHGMPLTTRALTGGLPLREWETEYVRADQLAGAVEALRRIVDLPCPLGRDGDRLGEAQKIASTAITAYGGQ